MKSGDYSFKVRVGLRESGSAVGGVEYVDEREGGAWCWSGEDAATVHATGSPASLSELESTPMSGLIKRVKVGSPMVCFDALSAVASIAIHGM